VDGSWNKEEESETTDYAVMRGVVVGKLTDEERKWEREKKGGKCGERVYRG
jgi:hypothetical protein